MDFVVTPDQARAITNESDAKYKHCLKLAYDTIKKAAQEGNRKVLFPSMPTYALEDKVKDHLIINGYQIGWWDSSTSNTTIHW
jgi:hypothetical protein